MCSLLPWYTEFPVYFFSIASESPLEKTGENKNPRLEFACHPGFKNFKILKDLSKTVPG
jgi:hypothetical protein